MKIPESQILIQKAFTRMNSMDAVRGFAQRHGHIRESEELERGRLVILELVNYILKKEEQE